MTSGPAPAVRRALFVATILAGSVLLFLVQPMVARMALPKLGGAPNVWNSAMLVYQALLLGGYAYAHWLSRWPVRRQASVHLALLILAAATLPIHLAALAPPGQQRRAKGAEQRRRAAIGREQGKFLDHAPDACGPDTFAPGSFAPTNS